MPQKPAKRGGPGAGSNQIIVRRVLREPCLGFNRVIIGLFVTFVCNPIKLLMAECYHVTRGILNPSASGKCIAPGNLKGYRVKFIVPV